MNDDTIIDASAAFASKAGKTEKARKTGESHGASPDKLMKQARLPRFSTQQLRQKACEIVPGLKAERKEREKRGAKSQFNEERFDAICQRMAAGMTTREAIDAEGIASSTFYEWKEKGGGDAAIASQCQAKFARARELLAEYAFGEALAVPRELYQLAVTGGGSAGIPVDSAMVSAGKLYSDSLRWYAEKLNPKTYGASKDSAPTVNVTNNSLTIDSRSLDAGQRDQLRTLLLSTSKAPVIEG